MGIFLEFLAAFFQTKDRVKRNGAVGQNVLVVDSDPVMVVPKVLYWSPVCLVAAAKKFLTTLPICSVPKDRFRPYG